MNIRAEIIVAALFVAAMSGSASGQSESVQTKDIPALSLFPMLKEYYKLPSAKRTHFRPNYYLNSKSGGHLDAILLRRSGAMPMTIGPQGLMSPLPGAEDIADGAQIRLTAPQGTKLSVTIQLASSTALAATLDAKDLKASIEQAKSGAKQLAGIGGFMVPNYRMVCFEGVGGGTAVTASGSAATLPELISRQTHLARPCFAPLDMPNAVQIRLDRKPTAILIVEK